MKMSCPLALHHSSRSMVSRGARAQSISDKWEDLIRDLDTGLALFQGWAHKRGFWPPTRSAKKKRRVLSAEMSISICVAS